MLVLDRSQHQIYIIDSSLGHARHYLQDKGEETHLLGQQACEDLVVIDENGSHTTIGHHDMGISV